MSSVTAQDFYDYEKCPHRVYLNRHGDPNEKLPHSEFLNMLFERALLHEQEVIRNLVYEVPLGERLEDRFLATFELMSRGAERIFQGVLMEGNDCGIPDLLERVDGTSSSFGAFFYKPVDIKSGSGYDNPDKQTLRDDYGMQLFHYGSLLHRIQNFFPTNGEIINKLGQRVTYPLQNFGALFVQTLPEVQALVSGAMTDEPVRSGYCPECQWWGHCESILTAANDVSLLPDVGRSKRAALFDVGVKEIAAVREFDFSATKVKGFGLKTTNAVQRAARVYLTNTPEPISKPVVPDAPLRIYLDFEDDPMQELIYLCGIWAEPPLGGLNYHGSIATTEVGEASLWAAFQQFCKRIENDDYIVFHYSPYEKTKISQLEKKHGVAEKTALDLFRSRLVDLKPIVENSIALPIRGYGIKHVGKFIGFKYTAANAGGAQSIVWFREYQKDQSRVDTLETLRNYNQEDCLAMKAVRAWLMTL